MFSVYIVDDDITKIENIIEGLNVYSSLDLNIEYELELKNACRTLESRRFDLLILDIQLPSLGSKERTSKEGGVQLLRLLSEVDSMKKPTTIIGLTAYDENYDEIQKQFEDKLWHLIKYDSKSESWKNQIIEKVDYLIKAKTELCSEVMDKGAEPQVHCAVITAVPTETESVLKCGLEWNKYLIDGDPTIYYLSEYEKDNQKIKILLAQQNQMGMPAASVLTTKVINTFSPQIICMIGITGGRKGEVELGDLIIASESWDYGSGKIMPKEDGKGMILSPEPHQIGIFPAIKEYMMGNFDDLLYEIRKSWNASNGNKMNKDIVIHVGALATGASVVQDERVVTDFILPQNRKVLGVDMETYAVYYASCNTYNSRPAFLSIKGVCDYADKGKNDAYQHYAAYASTQFFINVIHELLNRI